MVLKNVFVIYNCYHSKTLTIMLEIVVTTFNQNPEGAEPDIRITVTIKQTYEIILIKTQNDVQVKIPSLVRPVLKFSWDLESPNKVYKEHWNMLKESIRKGTKSTIVFNDTDGEHSVRHDGSTLFFLIWTFEHGKFEYIIPIDDSNSEDILKMIDDIIKLYPEEELPLSFSYPADQFPLYFASVKDEYVHIQFFPEQFSNARMIKISRRRAYLILQKLKRLNDEPLLIEDGMYFNKNQDLTVQYQDGIFTSSFDIPQNRFEMVIKELERVVE